ncbi:MAG: hypothetical protein INH40_19635, partial [Acidobacteriaceae bacterium]|nr:hypothetical protein [Acidobacteriaceae bacterium]
MARPVMTTPDQKAGGEKAGDPRLDYQFDIYARYGLLADILVEGFGGRERCRLLDVGAGPQQLLAEFLPPGFAEITRTDVKGFDDPGLVIVRPGDALPFADGSFEAVVAMDVLEHVAPAQRTSFLLDALRVSARLLVIATPIGCPAVEEAEREFGAAFLHLFGHQDHFLAEHAAFGLPRPSEVEAALGATGAFQLAIDNVRLADWLALNVSNLFLSTVNDGDGVRRHQNRRQNVAIPAALRGTQHYRRFYIASPDEALMARLASRFDPARLQDAGTRPAQPLLVLAEHFRDYAAAYDAPFVDGMREALAAKDSHIAGLDQTLDGTREALAAKDSHIAGLDQTLDGMREALAAKDSHIAGLDQTL